MRYELWAIEVDTPDGPALWRRVCEAGEGSPLVWDSREDAEAVIGEMGPGSAHELRPVLLSGQTATPTPARPARLDRTAPMELADRFLRGPDSY